MWQRVRITDHRRQLVLARRAAACACLAGAWLAGMLLASTLAGMPARALAQVAGPDGAQTSASDPPANTSATAPSSAAASEAAATAEVVVVPLALPAAPEQAPATTAGDAPSAQIDPTTETQRIVEPEAGTGAPESASGAAPEATPAAPEAAPEAASEDRLVTDAAALYDVAVPVADQSERARRQGGRAALRIVLMRLTGLAELPPSEALAAAERNPEGLVARFGYQSEPQSGPQSGPELGQQSAPQAAPQAQSQLQQQGEPSVVANGPGAAVPAPPQLMLRVTFSQSALFQLIREARLPVWPSARPRMRIWLFVDAGGDPYNLGGRAQEPAIVAATERAAQWGLPVWVDPTPSLPEVWLEGWSEKLPDAGPTVLSEASLAAVSPEASSEPVTEGPPPASDRLRAPQSIALRPSQAPGWPVWPVASIWSASRDELAALSSAPGSGFDAVLPAPAPAPAPGARSVESPVAGAHGSAAPNPDESPVPALITGDAAAIWRGTLEIHDPAPPAAAIAAAEQQPLESGGPPAIAPAIAPAIVPANAPPALASAQITEAPAAVRIDLGAGPAAALASAAVDRLVAHLLPRFQVAPGTEGTLSLQVTGIRSVADYASVLRRLGAVEVIDDVRVAGAAGDRIDFRITTGAQVAQLAAVLVTDGRLRPLEPAAGVASGGAAMPAEAPVPTPDLVLEWQGG